MVRCLVKENIRRASFTSIALSLEKRSNWILSYHYIISLYIQCTIVIIERIYDDSIPINCYPSTFYKVWNFWDPIKLNLVLFDICEIESLEVNLVTIIWIHVNELPSTCDSIKNWTKIKFRNHECIDVFYNF